VVNDFAQIKSLDNKILDELEDVVAGQENGWPARVIWVSLAWMPLFYDGKIVITEINPRFQGSS